MAGPDDEQQHEAEGRRWKDQATPARTITSNQKAAQTRNKRTDHTINGEQASASGN